MPYILNYDVILIKVIVVEIEDGFILIFGKSNTVM